MPTPLYGRIDGLLYDLSVQMGQQVKQGEQMYVVEAAKSQLFVNAPFDATVVQVLRAAGDKIAAGDVVLELEPIGSARS